MKKSIGFRKQLKRASGAILALLLVCLPMLGTLPTVAEDVGAAYFYAESFESDFASRPTGWLGNGYYSLRSTDRATDGSASLLLRDESASASVSSVSPALAFKPGVYYRISVDVYNKTGNGSVFVQFYNASGTQTDSVSTTVTVTGRWETATLTVSLPEGAATARVNLYSGQANRGETYFDNLIVAEDPEDAGQTDYGFSAKITSHPRLWATAPELEALRAATASTAPGLSGYSAAEAKEALLAGAEKLLTQSSFTVTYFSSTSVNFSIPFAERHFTSSPSGYGGTNYPYWQEMANQQMEMLQTLSLAYALTDNASYAERAVSLALSLADWSSWTEYPSVNRTSLETGYLTIGVATVYDFCYEKLNADQRETLEAALLTKGLQPLFADLSAFTDHNYYVNKASALATGSLALLGTAPDTSKYLSRAYDFLSWYLDCRMESESNEGLSYTSYSMELLSVALDQLRRVTGNTALLSHPYTDTVIRWAVMTGENGGSGAPISDHFSNSYFFVTAGILQGTDCAGLAAWYLSSRVPDDVSTFRKLIYFRSADGLETESPEDYAARTGINLSRGVVPGVGWGVLRAGWEQDDLLLVCVANNSSQGHSHYDQNSFVLSAGSGWILTDPGYQNYGGGNAAEYTTAYGHSTVYVDGKSQSVKGGATLRTLLDGASLSALRGSAAGAYTDPALNLFDRTFFLVRSGGAVYYVIADDLSATDAHTYSWVLNSQNLSSVRYYNDGGYDVISSTKPVRVSEVFATGAAGAVRVAFDRALTVSNGLWNNQGALVTAQGEETKDESFCAVISPLSGRGISYLTVEQSVSVAESFTNDRQIGVRTLHGGISDLIVLSRAANAEGTLAAGGLSAKGSAAALLGLSEDGTFVGYALTAGSELSRNGELLLRASAPVTAEISFGGEESYLSGPAGTEVTLFAPHGVGDQSPDASGFCRLTLTGERTVLSVRQGSSARPVAVPTDPETDSQTAEPAPRCGCRSTASFALLLPLLIVPAFFRKKK